MKFSNQKLNLLMASLYGEHNDMSSPKTLRAIASEIGISAGYLALLRNGSKTNPGPNTIAKLSRYFDVDPVDLFEEDSLNPAHLSLKISLDLCDELISTNHVDKALDVLDSLITTQSQELKQADLYESAILLRAVGISRKGNREHGMEIINKMLTRDDVSSSVRALSYYERSRIHYKSDYIERAIEDARMAIEVLQDEGNIKLMRSCNYALGVYYARIFKYALSILHYERARSLIENSTDEESAHIVLGLGQTYVLMNEPKAAKQYLMSAKEIYEVHHDIQSIANVYHNLSRCEYLHENYSAAKELLLQALEMHQRIQSVHGIAYDYLELARNAIKIGDYRAAKELANRSSVTFEAISHEGQAARAQLVQCESMVQTRDNLDEVTVILERIIGYFETRNWTHELGKSKLLLGAIRELNDQGMEACGIYKEVAIMYDAYLNKTIFPD